MLFSAAAQKNTGFDPLRDEISSKLPTLEVIIDSAIATNPSVHSRDLQLIVNSCRLKSDKHSWSRNLSMQADVRYGNFYSISSNSEGVIDPAFSSNRLESRYGGAVSMKLPLYDMINRKNQIKLAESEYEQAVSLAEMQRKEVRQVVIRQYNELILNQRLFKIKGKSLETARINLLMAEKQFSNGIIPISEYARISEIVSKSESEYEGARMDFLTSYQILEEIAGFSFNLSQTITGANESN
jgi:outer membrane protein TolC